MKGIVVDIRNRDVVVLSDEGNIIKIKNDNYRIGQEIKVSINNNKSKVKLIALVASFIITFTIVGGGAYASPYAYVSLDVNPSIEYSVNVFGRVVEASGVNEEGKDIISNIKVENKTIEEAIKDTISKITEQGYIKDGEDGDVVIATSSINKTKAEKLADELKVDVEKLIYENNLVAAVEAFSIGRDRVLEAKALGVTPGKLNLVEKLQKSVENPDNISIEEWLSKPVKEIMRETKSEEQKAKPEEAVKSNKEQGEVTNDIEKKETKNANENNSGNIAQEKAKNTISAENKAQNSTSVEKKIINTTPSENKAQSDENSAEANNKKGK